MPPGRAGDLSISSPLGELPGVGPVRSAALSQAGFDTVGDLLLHLPFRYEDRRRRFRIEDLAGEGERYLSGRLRDLRRVRIRRRGLSMVRGWLDDETGSLAVLWFNRPYLPNQLREGDEYALYGAVRRRGGRWELVNPTCEQVGGELRQCGRIVPVYASVGKLGPAGLRRLLGATLDRLELGALEDPLPESLRRRHRLPPLGSALRSLHRPKDDDDVERLNSRRSPAHARLIYGELLELQLELGLLRSKETRERKRHRYRVDDSLRRTIREILPFRLTAAQKTSLGEIVRDLESPFPMLRLLQGDVGSGKTIVAALALVTAMESGLQGAFMAPTELLAEQHFRSLSRLLGGRYRLALLTGSAEGGDQLREDLRAGEIQLVVGTHALIQQGVEFRRLALAVVDEQHRFGVSQRRVLQAKGDRPDMLVMTATPIPRSLALTVYGDLACSVIDELPPGRTPIVTRVISAARRRQVYSWLSRQLDRGAQAYIVFPLIEESDRLEADSLERLGSEVQEGLADHPSAVMHGRLSAPDREVVMERFAAGEIRVLLATTVIEVGVDVPGANVMIIESAERFGLAQIHQLRGRIGRGAKRSYCVAIHNRLGELARRRLEIFAASDDGFRIAEKDLEIRGPGDLLGTRQAGLPLFRIADLVSDRDWLERARSDALEVLSAPREWGAAPLLARLERRVEDRYRRFAGG